jgi:DNA (cytosine-5)-methyltransferase 1
MFRVLDLFSGIGGFSLGLERTGGFKTVAFCEIDPYCRKVLKKHWPDVPCYDDIRELTAERLAADGIATDAICGGFPCQDISLAGKRTGLEGSRSGLWSECARLISELRPRYVIVENVSALLSLGMARVCGDLAEIGYDATWDCIPASAVGAPHRRDRAWIIANAQSFRPSTRAPRQGCESALPNQNRNGAKRAVESRVAGNCTVADANLAGSQGRKRHELQERAGELPIGEGDPSMADPTEQGLEGSAGKGVPGEGWASIESAGRDWWFSEPNVGRVANGVPSRVDRLRALGNAVVPQIPELIGRAILQAEAEMR